MSRYLLRCGSHRAPGLGLGDASAGGARAVLVPLKARILLADDHVLVREGCG